MGLVPQIHQFCQSSRSQLAVSLHATTDEIRDWIAPVNRRWNLAQLMGTLREHFPAPVRRPPAGAAPAGSCGEAGAGVDAAPPRAEEMPVYDSGVSGSSGIAALSAASLGAATALVTEDAGSRDPATGLAMGAAAGAGAAASLEVPIARRRFGRFVLMEYVMLRGVNDTEGDAVRCFFLP